MTDPPATTEVVQLDRRRILWILTALLLAQAMAAIEGTVVATALPTIIGDLGGLDLYSWVFTSYLIASTASTPLWGKLSDLYGRRHLFHTTIVIFLIGSVLAAAAQSMGQLIAFRLVQGLGAGGLFALSMTIIGDVVSPRERGRYQGYMGGMFAVATVLGPLVGGLLVDHAHWRFVFLMTVPLGVIALAMSWRLLRLPFTSREHVIDYLGSALLVTWVVAIVLGLEWGSSTGWGSPRALGALGVALAGLVAFFVHEQRAVEPVLPPRLLAERVVAVSSGLQFLTGAAMMAAAVFGPLFLQVVVGVDATRSGLLIVPMTLGMLLTSVGSGQIITRTGHYRTFPIVGTAVILAAVVGLSQMGVGTGRFDAMARLFALGAGIGFVMQVVLVAVQNRVAHEHLGVATSTANFFRSLGQTFGAAVLGAVLTTRLDVHLGRLVTGVELDAASLQQSPAGIRALPDEVRTGVIEAFAQSIHEVFLLTIPVCVVGFVLSFALPGHPLRTAAAVGQADHGREPAPVRVRGRP